MLLVQGVGIRAIRIERIQADFHMTARALVLGDREVKKFIVIIYLFIFMSIFKFFFESLIILNISSSACIATPGSFLFGP